MPRPDLDAIDLRILAVVQENSALSYQQISERIHLSLNPVWRRVKRLEDEGVIVRRVALLDPTKIGLTLVVFMEVRLAPADPQSTTRFLETVRRYPEIVEIHRISEVQDYLLKLRLSDLHAYDEVCQRLAAAIGFVATRTTFVIKEIRDTTTLPLSQVTPVAG